MAEQAKITSTDALERFRAALIEYLTESRRSLDEVTDTVRRTRSWVEMDQRTHWEGQLRRRRKLLSEVEAELFGARLSPLRDKTAKLQEDVRRARRAVAEAEDKLRLVKEWAKNFDSVVEPMTKRLHPLRHYLDHDLIKALSFLVQAQKTLEGYAEIPLHPPEPKAAPTDSESQPHPDAPRT